MVYKKIMDFDIPDENATLWEYALGKR